MWADFIIGVFMYLIPIIAVLWLLCDVVVFIGRLFRRFCKLYIQKIEFCTWTLDLVL